jgi:hypothetical protein
MRLARYDLFNTSVEVPAPQALDIPTLRKEREEWGTHFLASACAIKNN